jgi:hypothetical protein
MSTATITAIHSPCPVWCANQAHGIGDPVHFVGFDLGAGADLFVAARPEDNGPAVHLTDPNGHSVELDPAQTANLRAALAAVLGV